MHLVSTGGSLCCKSLPQHWVTLMRVRTTLSDNSRETPGQPKAVDKTSGPSYGPAHRYPWMHVPALSLTGQVRPSIPRDPQDARMTPLLHDKLEWNDNSSGHCLWEGQEAILMSSYLDQKSWPLLALLHSQRQFLYHFHCHTCWAILRDARGKWLDQCHLCLSFRNESGRKKRLCIEVLKALPWIVVYSH